MAGSTYSSNLKIELMTTGENSGTWGDITNTNLGTALEQAIVGYGNPDYTSDANLTISITNSNAAQAARALVLNVTSVFGSLTATRELVVPTIQKQYIVQNNTTGGQSITVKTSAGTGITVPNGRKAHLYVDGTNVIQMFDFVDINGGTIDGTAIGGSSAAAGAFTTLAASGATTLNGAVTLGDAAGDNITFNGTVTSHLLFTDNTYDIGASGATRPRNLYLAGAATIGGNLSVGGTLTLTGGVNLNGNVTVGDSAADTLTINSTITSNLLFTDNTYDIGASGATRPRNLFLAGNITAGGNQTLTGSLTVDSTTDSSSTTTGSIQTDGGVGIAKKLFVGLDANIYGITVGRGAGAVSTNTAVGASALVANTTGSLSTAVGYNALAANTSGYPNSALGVYALKANTTGANNNAFGYNSLQANTTGGQNTAYGGSTLYTNTTGSNNTALGDAALYYNTTASNSTAVGYQAGYSNTTGGQNQYFGYQAGYTNATNDGNHAFGYRALYASTAAGNSAFGSFTLTANTTGNYNSAFGFNALAANTTAGYNTAVGYQALYTNVTGSQSTAIGYQALYNNTNNQNSAVGFQALYGNTSGYYNVAMGEQALFANTTGLNNVAFGFNALRSNTTASSNTALGHQASYSNTTGAYNTAVGFQAAYSGVSRTGVTAVGYQAAYSNAGDSVTAFGFQCLYNNNISGAANTAFGYNAGYSNTTGVVDAFGTNALYANTTGSSNTAFGNTCLTANTTGSNNTAMGYALYSNTTGSSNTAIGRFALAGNTTATGNTAIGYGAGNANTTGQYNVFVGYDAGKGVTTGSTNIAIGYTAMGNATGTSSAYNIAIGGGTLSSFTLNSAYGFNVCIGQDAGSSLVTGIQNTFIGTGYALGAGRYMTGNYNTVLGPYNGNQNGLDLRTSSNYVVLSDGEGNPRYTASGSKTNLGPWAPAPWAGSYGLELGKSAGFYGDGTVYEWTAGMTLNAYRSGSNQYKYRYASIPAGYIQLGNGGASAAGFTVGLATGGSADAVVSMTQVLRVELDTSLALQGADRYAGTGITFPASQFASSNANTLDDYEEGTWTPNLRFGGNSVGITYIYQSGNYVRVGRQVTAWGTIYLSSKGSSTGDSDISGLPYAPSNTFYNEQHGAVGELNNLTFSGFVGCRAGGSGVVQLFQYVSGAAQTILNNTNYVNNTSVAFFISYTTNV